MYRLVYTHCGGHPKGKHLEGRALCDCVNSREIIKYKSKFVINVGNKTLEYVLPAQNPANE